MDNLETVISRLKEIKTEMDKPDADISALSKEADELIERKKELIKEQDDAIKRKKLSEMLEENKVEVKPVDLDPDMIERKAFMNYVQTGKMSDALKRSDDHNVASDLGVMIPKTIQQEILKNVDSIYGSLYNKVKKLNIKGGVEYPIGSFSATFNRITETTKSDRQKGGSITGTVTFGYKIGEIRLAKTLLQSILTVPAFEAELAKVIAKAFVKAMDTEILNGDASANQMEGILTNTTVKKIEISATDMADWKTLFSKITAEMPLGLLNSPYEYVMSAGTFFGDLMTLHNDNNSPVSQFVTEKAGAKGSILGHDVTLVEPDLFGDFDALATSTTNAPKYFGMIWLPEEAYAVNSNMNFTVTQYPDHEKNEIVTKALVVNDGHVLRGDRIYLLKKVA